MKKAMPTFLQHPLAREITVAIVIKLLVIVAIFYAFFSGHAIHPDADAVSDRLANPHQPTEQ
jgi:cell division protein FtsN